MVWVFRRRTAHSVRNTLDQIQIRPPVQTLPTTPDWRPLFLTSPRALTPPSTADLRTGPPQIGKWRTAPGGFPVKVGKKMLQALDITPISQETGSLSGGVAEWSIAAVLKTAERASVPWVRIPPPPPHSDTESVQGPRLGPFFLLFQRALAGAIRPSETGRLTQNGSPDGPRLSSSAPRRYGTA